MRGRAGEQLRKSSQPQQSKTFQNEEIQNRDQSNDWIIVKLHSKLKTLEGKYNNFVNTCSALMKENKSILDNYFLQDRSSQQISVDRAKFEKDLQYILSVQAGIKEESSESGRNKEDSFAAVSEKLIETQSEIMRIFSGKLHSPEETKEDVLDVFNRMSSNLWGVLFRQKNKEESSEKTSELLKKIVKLEDEKKLLEKQVKDLMSRSKTSEINKILIEKQNLEQRVKEQFLQLEKFNSSAESFEITFDEKYKPQENNKLVEVDSMKKLLKETKDKYFSFEKQSRGRRVESSDMRLSKHSDSSFVMNKSPKPKEYSPIRNNSQKRSISPAERKIFDLNKETNQLKTSIEAISKERDVLKAWKANALKSPQSIQPNLQKTIQNLEADKDNLQRIIKIYQDKQRYLIRGIHSFIMCTSRMQKYLRKEDALKYSNLYEDEKHKLEIRVKEVENEQSSSKWSTQSSPWTTPTQTPFRSRILSKQDDTSVEELGYSKDINFLQDELVKQMESSQNIQKKLEEDLNKKINEEKTLKQKIEHLEEINKLSADENTELEKENDNLRAQLSKMKTEGQSAPVKVDYIKITNSLKIKIDELETTLEGKDKTIAFLNSKLESTKNSYESTKNWAEAQISQFFTEINSQIENFNKKADSQEIYLNSLEKLIKEKLNENYQTIEAMNEATEEREHLQYIMEQNQAYVDTTIKEMGETIEILERERDELKNEVSESKLAFLELEEKNKKNLQLEKEVKDLKAIINDYEKNEKEFKTELQKSHQKESNLEQVKYELSVVQRENKSLVDANNEKDKEIMSMQKRLQDQIMSTNSTIEEFEFKLRETKSQYEAQSQELENMTKKYNSLAKNYQETQTKTQSLEKRASGIDREKELKYAQEIQDLRNENISLNRLFKHKEEKFIKELEDLKKEKELSNLSIREKETKLINENESLLKEFKEKELKLSSEIEKIKNELLLEKEKELIFISEIENYKNEISQLEKVKKEKEIKYSKEIEELKKENHSLGINKEREAKMIHEIEVLKREHSLLANTGKDKEIKLIQEIDSLNKENSILRSAKESSDKEWNNLIKTEIVSSEALKSEKDELAGMLEREKEKYKKLEKINKEKDEFLNKEKEKIKILEENISEKDSNLIFYEEALNKLNEEIVSLKMENERLSELNKVMTMTKNGNEKDKEIIGKLEENIDRVQRELKKKLDEEEHLRSHLKSKEIEIEEIQKKNEFLEEELEKNKDQIASLERKNADEAKLNRSKHEETKTLLANLIKEKEASQIQKIENLKDILSKLENRLKNLKERFDNSQEQTKILSSLNETKQLDSDEDSNSILLSKIEALEFTLGETQAWSDSKIKELDEQIDTLLQEKEDLTSQIQEQKNDISRIPTLLNKIDSLEKANQSLQTENKTLKDSSVETSQLRQQINMKNFENDGLKYEKQALNEEKQRLLEEQDRLSKELEELTTISKNELLNANKKIESLHFELTTVKHELDQEKEKSQISEEKVKNTNEELKAIIDQKNQLKNEFDNFKQNKQSNSENSEDVEKLTELYQEKQNELKNYEAKVKELENKVESLQNELSDKTNTLMLYDEELFKLKSDYQNFSTEKENLVSKLAEKEQEVLNLSAENESSHAEQMQLSKIMEQVLSDSKASKLQYEQTIKELESKHNPKPQVISSSNKKYEELLQERENKIADLECKINSAEEALGGFFNEDLSKSIINLVSQRTQGIKKPPPRPPVGRFRSKRAGEQSPSDQQGDPDEFNVSGSSQNSDKNSESSWASMPAKLSADVQVLQSELNDEKVTVDRLQHQNKLLKEHIRDLERQVKISQNFNQGARDGSMSKEQLKNTIISLIKILPPLPNEGEATVRIILSMLELSKEEMVDIDRERIERDKKSAKPKGKFMGIFNR
ncbi:unnamed protein product [Blepharisma stoltei]|uniref:GRIP domain-containing protein n=1 Tax=Blepharisma stoltei TaxID=1481888 RepID=A0AAU9J3E6_9CILI|nr:unnamed protein product [Blepharisma stoltei]